ncbi:type IV pili twitching motility protein PilT, partial [Candidatus Sumerlaeota bacterium]|nr:type IV pili twitching motility protein PilT [Candidatus Sumerlaeota bacterium]
MAKIDRLFEAMLTNSASDLHIAEGQPPKYRIHGTVTPTSDPPLDGTMLGSMLSEICDPERWETFLNVGDLDFAYALG